MLRHASRQPGGLRTHRRLDDRCVALSDVEVAKLGARRFAADRTWCFAIHDGCLETARWRVALGVGLEHLKSSLRLCAAPCPNRRFDSPRQLLS